jgi:S1-C subfamily serine protease
MNIEEKVAMVGVVIGFIAAVTVGIINRLPKNVPVFDKVVELHITLNDKASADAKKTHGRLVKVGDKAICSGFFVDNRGTIMTAAHCTEDVKSIDVMTSDHAVYASSFVSKSRTHDIALIRIDKRDTPFFTLARVVKQGEKIIAYGSPMGETGCLSEGTVAKVAGDVFLADLTIIPGNSGGPVLNAAGEVVGVAVAVFVSEYGMARLGVVEGPDTAATFLASFLRRK